METLNLDIDEIAKVWPIASKAVSVLHTKEQYENAVRILDNLIDIIGNDEEHPLASLMETIGALIEKYENIHFPEVPGDPIGCLKFLMEEHHLMTNDLMEIGSQNVVSEILSGKRQLTTSQIKALSKRFNVSPAVFF